MLWVDKHRPKSLEELDLYPDLTGTLLNLSNAKDIPHLLFYGPSGGGKKTRVMALLNHIYGPSVYSLRLEHRSIEVSKSKKLDISTLSSPHHVDLNPSDAGYYDRVVVMEMIKDIASTVPFHIKTPDSNTANYKVVVLNEVDKMSRTAQHALRRTMEKYSRTCRLILICTSTSRLIPPLRSRCLSIRVPSHNLENITQVVQKICRNESRAVPSSLFIETLAHRCDGNLRRGLLMLEASVMTGVDLNKDGSAIPQPDWQLFLQQICADILAEQTPKKLHDIRLQFYDLLAQCISGETILRELVDHLLLSVKTEHKIEIIRLAAQYDHNMKLGTRDILHLEAFVAGVMKVLKNQSA